MRRGLVRTVADEDLKRMAEAAERIASSATKARGEAGGSCRVAEGEAGRDWVGGAGEDAGSGCREFGEGD